MKTILKYLSFFFLLLFVTKVQSQSKVAVEQIQYFSVVAPTANYWHVPLDLTPILETLDSGLFKKLDLLRDKSYKTNTVKLSKPNQLGKITLDWSRSTNTNLHAYIELYELSPDFVFQNELGQIEESKKDSITSIWIISCVIFNQSKQIIFKKSILLSMVPSKTIGMGYHLDLPPTTPNLIFKAIQKGLGLLSPKIEDMELIEAKVPAAYAIDNFWMPFLQNKNRIQLDTSKSFISYSIENTIQLLRTPPAQMNKINLKDKSLNNPYSDILPTIKKRLGSNVNEYYHVLQPLRDVNKNLDYNLVAYIELNLNQSEQELGSSPILFLPGNLHTIFLEQDSVGSFRVEENVVEKDKFLNPNIVFNGFDSTKKFDIGTLYEKKKVVSSKSIEGNFKNHRFKILINYAFNLKTIYIDDKMVLVAEGKNKPYQMVFSNADSQTDLSNFLLQMSFSEIFQLPT